MFKIFYEKIYEFVEQKLCFVIIILHTIFLIKILKSLALLSEKKTFIQLLFFLQNAGGTPALDAISRLTQMTGELFLINKNALIN